MENTGRKGVYYRVKESKSTGKEEKIFYIQYYSPDKKRHMEAVGSSIKGMTAAKASNIRSMRILGKEQSNREKIQTEKEAKEAESNRWTITKLWEEYKSTKNVKWIYNDDKRFYKYIKEPLGNLEPKEITHFHIARLRKQLQKEEVKPATEKHALEIVRRVCAFGVKKNLCAGLTFVIEMPELNNEKTEDLTPEQFQQLWKAIETETHVQSKNIVKLVLFTGMRRGELFNLKWEDINFKRGFIRIKDPKGGKDQEIPLSDSARELLLNHERPYPESPYVFPGRYGKKRTDINKQVSRIKKAANLPNDFRILHGLRHVYASMLASSGKVDMYTLQKLLTHKSPQMTQRYAHLRDDALKKAAQVAVDVIGETLQAAQAESQKKIS